MARDERNRKAGLQPIVDSDLEELVPDQVYELIDFELIDHVILLHLKSATKVTFSGLLLVSSLPASRHLPTQSY